MIKDIYFYSTRTIFNGFVTKNKYFLLLLVLINFLFNHNISIFQNVNPYQLTFLTSIFYCVMLYLIYLKFNLVVRVIAPLKNIPFFYNQNQFRHYNMRVIAFYYYSFNIFILIISLFLINNTHNNLIHLNLISYINYTTIFSIIWLVINTNTILDVVVNIQNNISVSHLSVIGLFIVFILFNLYQVKINWVFEEYILKYITIHCDPNDTNDDSDTDTIRNVQRGRSTTVVIGVNSSRSIGHNNSNIYINTPSGSASTSLGEGSSKELVSTKEESTTHSKYFIKEIEKINKKFFPYLIERYEMDKDSNLCSDELYNKFLNKRYNKYILDNNLIKFLNKSLDTIIEMTKTNNNQRMTTKEISEYIYNLHEIDQGHQSRLNEINAQYHKSMKELKDYGDLTKKQLLAYSKQFFDAEKKYDHFTKVGYYEEAEQIANRHIEECNQLEKQNMEEIYEAAKAFRNKPNNRQNFLNYLSRNKSNPNLPELNWTYPENQDIKMKSLINQMTTQNIENELETSELRDRIGNSHLEEPKATLHKSSSAETIKPIKPKPF
uniref:Uncharacterized protein n=1 Tax=Tricholoma saponaceum TaxID=113602 RepID=A0A6C0W4G1_9AGAR|nr:hypothetical protein [Tricholoma saponaceum]QIC20296.1 hypothetical protein [Tricholoma saponaceum]